MDLDDDLSLENILEKSLRQNDSEESFVVEEGGDDYEIRFAEDGSYTKTPLEDEDESSFIRIRSQNDGIFEQDDEEEDEIGMEEEDEEFYDFTIPEIELGSPPSRKRKQQLGCIDNELTDIIEVNDEEGPQYGDHDPMFSLDADFIPTKKRDRLPLYLLNPEEFGHDPKKQMQIRRAIITYRHHQDKKEQIIKLTEENKKLRLHNSALKTKVAELSKCGCEKNKSVTLDELNVVIPVVPPRMYVRGNRAILGVPYNKRAGSPTTTTSLSKLPATVVKSEIDVSVSSTLTTATSTITTPTLPPNPPPPKPVVQVPKPLINITSTRLAGLNSSTLNTNNVVTATLPKPPLRKVLPNGTASATLPLTKRTLTAGNLLQTGNRVSANRQTGLISLSSVKTESGEFIQLPMAIKHGNQIDTTASSVKDALGSPATTASVSRIVFAKKGNPSSSKIQTASQLIFGMKSNQKQPTNPIQTSQPALQVPRTHLTFATQPKLDASPLRPFMNARLSNKTGQVFTTASGQVLKLVQSTMTRGTPGKAPSLPPKRNDVIDLNADAMNREIEKKQMEEMWQQLDNGDDEMEIIAALSGTGPVQRNRKQAFSQRTQPDGHRTVESTNRSVLQSYGDLELNKYEDIVFEEAE